MCAKRCTCGYVWPSANYLTPMSRRLPIQQSEGVLTLDVVRYLFYFLSKVRLSRGLVLAKSVFCWSPYLAFRRCRTSLITGWFPALLSPISHSLRIFSTFPTPSVRYCLMPSKRRPPRAELLNLRRV